MNTAHRPELDALRAECMSLAASADLRVEVHTAPQDNGAAHIEFDGEQYSYVITERGSELERRRSTDREDVMYWLISDAAFSAACKYEHAHRIAGRDFRRTLFAKELELLGSVRAEWRLRKTRELEEILKTYPYSDASS